jgi:predicted RNase H-like nuclease (RuvC/YqgF family)
MKHRRHFRNANDVALREAARIGALISDLDRRAQLLDRDISAEEEHALVFNLFDAAYPVLARTLAARRDNLKATIAMLEKRLASLQERADIKEWAQSKISILDDSLNGAKQDSAPS